MEKRASVDDFVEILKEKMGSAEGMRTPLRPWQPEGNQRWKWKDTLEEKMSKIPNGKAVGRMVCPSSYLNNSQI